MTGYCPDCGGAGWCPDSDGPYRCTRCYGTGRTRMICLACGSRCLARIGDRTADGQALVKCCACLETQTREVPA